MKLKPRKLIGLIVVAIIVMVALVFYREGTLPVDKSSKEAKIFVIRPGDDLNVIANRLAEEKLIRSRLVFFAVVKQLGIEKKIQAGDFRLSPSMGVYQIAQNLTHGTLDVWVTIIEGLRKEEIAQELSKKLNISEVEFNAKAKEGNLFPDTYLMPRKATVEDILSVLNNNFDNKFNDELKEKGQKIGLEPNDIIILASLIEKEGKTNLDRPQIASILLRRLQTGMKLDIDATVQYALGYQIEEKTWWKKELTNEDKLINSAYNTYLNAGLPPGPICNPGLASINAVINANPNTPYLYYIHDKQGRVHFAQNLSQHEANIEKYLR